MNEWQPINTAPIDYPVAVGRWEYSYKKDEPFEWRMRVEIVFMRGRFGRKKRNPYLSKEFTHWRWLPDAPKAGQ